jgi:hypothetical protein
MKLSQTIAEVVALATAIQNYWNTELPKRHPHYPVVSLNEDSGPPPLEQAKLRNLLSSLPEEEIYALMLVMYVGRGDIGTDDLATHYEKLKERFPNPEWAISQMEGKAPLAEYLADGLAEFEKCGADVNQLAFSSVKTS